MLALGARGTEGLVFYTGSNHQSETSGEWGGDRSTVCSTGWARWASQSRGYLWATGTGLTRASHIISCSVFNAFHPVILKSARLWDGED